MLSLFAFLFVLVGDTVVAATDKLQNLGGSTQWESVSALGEPSGVRAGWAFSQLVGFGLFPPRLCLLSGLSLLPLSQRMGKRGWKIIWALGLVSASATFTSLALAGSRSPGHTSYKETQGLQPSVCAGDKEWDLMVI